MPESIGTTINLVVSGVTARALLWPDFAPKSVTALVRSLPLELPLQHCKWSGPACFAELAGGAITEIDGIETPVTSIYPGVLALRSPTPTLPHGELLIAYGDAEYRMPDGRRFVTPLGELERGSDAFLAALGRTAIEGRTTLRLTAAKAG
jgi:uncharacterized protein DUF3830